MAVARKSLCDGSHESCRSASLSRLSVFGRPSERDIEPEGAALAKDAVEADAAAHGLDQLPADGQPDAGAFDIGGLGTETRKGQENLVMVFGGDADAGVGDADAQHAGLGDRAAYGHGAAFSIVFHGVRQEVQEHLTMAP